MLATTDLPGSMFQAHILKVPFLVIVAILTFQSFTPPEKPPMEREQEKAEAAPGIMRRYPRVQKVLWGCKIASMTFFCGISLVEAALILLYHSSWIYSAYVPRSMLPFVRLERLGLSPGSLAGCLLVVAGGLLRIRCYRELGRLFTYQLSIRDDHKLVTTGPYSIVRHPSYLGVFVLVIGNITLLASRGSWFVESGLWDTYWGRRIGCSAAAYFMFTALRLFSRVHQEDGMMRKEFGKEWEEWAKKTPYRLIPFVY